MSTPKFPRRAGHEPMCILNFGLPYPGDEKTCDCGAWRREKETQAKLATLGCPHRFTGFRGAKVCALCGKTKRELADLRREVGDHEGR